ncbi:hypothetical protein [Levilactobacillus namurensis]|uniref:hypothetical protein n=1 Tax=Levilactobacillus namurensis TaxID=380393 RepID=UPI00222F3280|nr:hypothetical protein [Levilactobacillus namurensis]MCW3777892.1 hypothetical protein [Levilactobacillus namurensis]MDT7018241.1 hypothetical protein [Levilactobacillus namurensis]WNN64772.1 hypothetical protein RIN67_08610 [Levilactobacillus namurensis]
MEIKMTGYCPYCKKEDHKQIANGLLNNDNYSILKCPKGHSFIVYLQNNKYEWLIRNSLNAFNDHYYLEAFMSLYQSIEQFRISFIEASYIKHNQARFKHIEKMFETNPDSTQILGAYKSAYFLETGELVDLNNSRHKLSTKNMSIVPLRNKIVHQGYYPNEQEVLRAGDIIIKYIASVEQIIKFHVDPNPMNPRLTKLMVPVDINLMAQLPGLTEHFAISKIQKHNPSDLDIFPFEDETLHLSGFISDGRKLPSFQRLANIRKKNKFAEFEVDE